MTQLFTLECPGDEAVLWIIEALTRADLQVTTSFDLRVAREAHSDCPCPYHGTAVCDCQMVVLVVYGPSAAPATLVVHSRDGHTWLSPADDPGKRLSRKLVAAFRAKLSSDNSPLHLQARPAPQTSDEA
jgi:hypothetical protein